MTLDRILRNLLLAFCVTAPVLAGAYGEPLRVGDEVLVSGETTLRRTGSARGAVLTTVPDGSVANIVAIRNGWALIESGTLRGWVPRSTLAYAAPAHRPLHVLRSTDLRGEPSMTAIPLARLRADTALTFVSSKGAWTQARMADGTTGWVLTGDVAGPPVPVGILEPSGTVIERIVVMQPTTLRAGPVLAEAEILPLAADETIAILSERGEWVKVRTVTGQVGWIPVAHVAGFRPAAPFAPGNALVVTDSISLRVMPDLATAMRLRLVPGSRIVVTGIEPEWIRVTTSDGSSGWMRLEDARLMERVFDEVPASRDVSELLR